MIKPYTAANSYLTTVDLRAASKAAAEEVKAIEATLIAARDRRDALKLEAFRRKHADRISAAIGTIMADDALRASLEALRGSKTARINGPREYGHPAKPAWQVIVGPGHAQHWQNDTDRRMIEIVLALIPAKPARG